MAFCCRLLFRGHTGDGALYVLGPLLTFVAASAYCELYYGQFPIAGFCGETAIGFSAIRLF